MPVTTHLKSLQALEMALRRGSLKAAAEGLGISPAAVGQRIRALEDYLGTDLLVRGRSGLQPTAALEQAVADLKAGFAALDRVTEALDFQRMAEIHMVADTDWAALWLAPRLPAFRERNPNVLFCINGEGDVPLRLGAPDLRVEYGQPGSGPAELLFTDLLVPVTGPDNLRRLGDWDRESVLEGLPLLHLVAQQEDPLRPGWPDWIAAHGDRREGAERGVHYRQAAFAMEAVRQNVGFLICGMALAQHDLEAGRVVMPFAPARAITAPCPYRMRVSAASARRPQLRAFVEWLGAEARRTRDWLASQAGAA